MALVREKANKRRVIVRYELYKFSTGIFLYWPVQNFISKYDE